MIIIQLIFRGLLLIGYTVLAFIYKGKVLSLPYIYYLPLFLYFLAIALKNFLPTKRIIPSHRYYKSHYKKKSYDINNVTALNKKRNNGAIIILSIWLFCLSILGVLHIFGYIKAYQVVWFVFLFHFLDLICLNYWCPFRIILKNKCCMDCRISNWDNFFRFSPLLFIGGFFTTPLAILGVISLLQWEYMYMKHRERFYLTSNAFNNCANCRNEHCKMHKN